MPWALETSIPVPLSVWLALLPSAITFTIGLTAAFGFGLRPGQKLALPALVSGLWSEDPRARLIASRALSMKAAYVLLWLALIALGESIRRRLADRLSWKVAQAVSGFGALAVAVGAIWAFVPLLVSLPGSWTVYLPRHQANWFASAVVTSLVAWWLVRASAHPNPAPRNLGPRNLTSN